jgi:hypothetical protein
MFMGNAVYEWPEADTLYQACNMYAFCQYHNESGKISFLNDIGG